jgi:hypothetical protein
MGKDNKKNRSSLYYLTLSVLLSLLAAAAMSQGQAHGITEVPSVSEL